MNFEKRVSSEGVAVSGLESSRVSTNTALQLQDARRAQGCRPSSIVNIGHSS